MQKQLSLEEFVKRRKMRFDGNTYEKEVDQKRLSGQALRVFDVMKDKKWRTLHQIQDHVQLRFGHFDPESSISARLRDLRKYKFGQHIVERQRRGNAADGLFEYRLIVNQNGQRGK